MSEIKTPNWRLSTCASASTGHRFLITNRETGVTTYFDSVNVWGGIVDEIRLYREDESMPSGYSRAGAVRDLDEIPDVILGALQHIEEEDSFPVSGWEIRGEWDD